MSTPGSAPGSAEVRTAVFDPCGDLPRGTTVLEASAGTGKTHTIASLTARYVAEGVARIDELMLVTFGRAATVELRERVRQRLVSVAQLLADPASAREHADPVVAHLATAGDVEVAERRDRLDRAVSDFDAATIATTHGFCQQMLAGLGVAADLDPDLVFTDATSEVSTEAVTDLFVRAYGRPDAAPPPFDLATAVRLGRSAVADGQARLEPRDAPPDSVPDVRRRLAEAVRAQVTVRKRGRRLIDYDDLLVHLRDALVDPATGPDARARIRGRYSVVMVDEFQDTDPVQWEILASAFHGHRTLVLIGDPKQAIYAFRGADVVTYLRATDRGDATATLGTNWRSEAPLLDAFEHLLGGAALGDDRIRVQPVVAAHPERRLQGGPRPEPFRLRVVDRDELPVGRSDLLGVATVRPYVARDVAGDIVAQLQAGATLGDRALRPGDIAVLVQRNDDAVTVRDALQAAQVPVVLTGTSSVFLSEAARDWLALLAALAQPQRHGLARAAALTSFVGWTPEQLARDDDAALDTLVARLHEWNDVLARRGVAGLFEHAGRGLAARVLATEQGERRLTDLRHIGQVLHAAAGPAGSAGPGGTGGPGGGTSPGGPGGSGSGGVASLVEWLQHRMAEAAADQTEERSRRLESDAEAVQVITVHRSKGLEFPVVYVPFLWDRFTPTKPDPLSLHDPAGTRVLDVGGPDGPGYEARRAVHLEEDAGESLRLAYVALTRASSQVVAHWAPTGNTTRAPLHRLLFGERRPDGEVPGSVPVGTDAFVRRTLATLAERSGGSIGVERAVPAPGRWQPPSPSYPSLAVRRFDRALDTTWTRTSYSRLTAGLHDAATEPISEPEAPGIVDEPVLAGAASPEQPTEPPTGPATGLPELPSPMADLPKGAGFGTLVHGVLETTDFAAADLPARLREEAERAGSFHVAGVPPARLAEALAPALETPLGPLVGDLRLADVTTGDRLDELDFELPLAGGDHPTAHNATVARIADLLRTHLPGDDPLRRYADDLADPAVAGRELRGFLTGSIDLVLRVRDGVDPRYVVIDYKTNWLGGERLSAADYTPSLMAGAMREAHYPLQALLYSVALHRFLRWRQPGYRPDRHLGGVLYLFLRGLCGPRTPRVGDMVCGAFAWTPPADLVVALSDLLAGSPGPASTAARRAR